MPGFLGEKKKLRILKAGKSFAVVQWHPTSLFLRKAENSLTSNHYVQFPTASSPFIPVFFPFGLLRPQWKMKEFSGRVIFDDLVLCSESRKKLEGWRNYGVLNKLFIVRPSILALCFIQFSFASFNCAGLNIMMSPAIQSTIPSNFDIISRHSDASRIVLAFCKGCLLNWGLQQQVIVECIRWPRSGSPCMAVSAFHSY